MPTFYETHIQPGQITRLSYLRLYDTNEQPWYIYPSLAGDLTLADRAPAGDLLTGPDTMYWLEIKTPAFVPWYLYPTAQEPREFALASVPIGGRPGFSFRPWVLSDGTRQMWLLGLSAAPDIQLYGGTVYVNGSHSIRACPRCSWVGHVDRSNARRDRDGTLLMDRCPQDGSKLTEERRLPPMPLPRHGRL